MCIGISTSYVLRTADRRSTRYMVVQVCNVAAFKLMKTRKARLYFGTCNFAAYEQYVKLVQDRGLGMLARIWPTNKSANAGGCRKLAKHPLVKGEDTEEVGTRMSAESSKGAMGIEEGRSECQSREPSCT